MQLEDYRSKFESLGISVAGMTYDSQEILAGFHAEEELGFPLLRDPNGVYVKELGIVNEGYEPGHALHGIPHPGVMWVDQTGVIRAKFAVPGYRQRPPFDALLKHISGLVGQ